MSDKLSGLDQLILEEMGRLDELSVDVNQSGASQRDQWSKKTLGKSGVGWPM